MKTNKDLIASIYDAFAHGNVPFILDSVSDAFTWHDPCDSSKAIQGGIYHGKEGFGQFFQKLVSSTETTMWEVQSYVSEGNMVVATGKHGIKAKSTGKSWVNDWVMIWEIENGKVIRGKSYFDTARYEALFQ